MKSGFYHNTPLAFAIFGGTGDLTKRKLIPALFSLVKEKRISDEISIVLVGRRNKDVIEFKEELLEFVKAYSRHKVKRMTEKHLLKKLITAGLISKMKKEDTMIWLKF